MALVLIPFPAELASAVASWARTDDETTMWCGHPVAPVPVEKIRAWAGETGVQPFGLFAEDQLVGYGEVWVDDAEHEVELARLIVDPRQRRRGVGRRLVAELVVQARASYPSIFMRVHPANAAALRCYAAAGFEPVDPVLAAEWNEPQPVAYAWLTLPRAGGTGSPSRR